VAIADGDIDFKVAGASTGTSPVAAVSPSIGNRVSSTVMPSSVHGLFDLVTATENDVNQTDYRVVYFHNKHATLTAQNVKIWLQGTPGDPAGGAVVGLAVDTTAASNYTGTNAAQAVTGADTGASAAASLTYVTDADTEGEAINLGNVGPGQVKAFWVRRAVADAAAVTEAITFAYKLETAP
jgi:hypothetical protein